MASPFDRPLFEPSTMNLGSMIPAPIPRSAVQSLGDSSVKSVWRQLTAAASAAGPVPQWTFWETAPFSSAVLVPTAPSMDVTGTASNTVYSPFAPHPVQMPPSGIYSPFAKPFHAAPVPMPITGLAPPPSTPSVPLTSLQAPTLPFVGLGIPVSPAVSAAPTVAHGGGGAAAAPASTNAANAKVGQGYKMCRQCNGTMPSRHTLCMRCGAMNTRPKQVPGGPKVPRSPIKSKRMGDRGSLVIRDDSPVQPDSLTRGTKRRHFTLDDDDGSIEASDSEMEGYAPPTLRMTPPDWTQVPTYRHELLVGQTRGALLQAYVYVPNRMFKIPEAVIDSMFPDALPY